MVGGSSAPAVDSIPSTVVSVGAALGSLAIGGGVVCPKDEDVVEMPGGIPPTIVVALIAPSGAEVVIS